MSTESPVRPQTLWQRGKLRAAFFCNLLLFFFSGAGLIMDLVAEGTQTFLYYTDIAALLCFGSAIALCISVGITLRRGRGSVPKWIKILRYIATSFSVTGVALSLMIVAPQEGFISTFFEDSRLLLNFLTPVLSFITFTVCEGIPSLRFRDLWWSVAVNAVYIGLVLPLTYFGFADAPYPFLDLTSGTIAGNVVAGILFLISAGLFSWMVYLCDKKVPDEEPRYYFHNP